MDRRLLPLLALVVALVAPSGLARAHVERETEFPPEPGAVPTYRKGGPTLLVCKAKRTLRRIHKLPKKAERRNLRLYDKCRDGGFRHIQAAVNNVKRQGTRILVLPGVYRERPYGRAPTGDCEGLEAERPLSYEQQVRCPGVDNLISIFGDSADPDRTCDLPVCRLQIEGTGKRPADVVIDNAFQKLNAIRADRADGIYFRNLLVQRSEFNAIYVIETDGFTIDRTIGRWNDEYGFLTFASDHGLYTRCEAYGNGDGGLYPGSAADAEGRPSIEIRHCRAHHNLIGISGTAGNDLYVHHNVIDNNSLGADEDSFFPGHPGMPQDGSVFRHNWIYSNNEDYNKYWEDGTCRNRDAARKRYPEGVVCPTLPAPIGTGIIILGGNNNTIEENYIFDNWRAGTLQLWVPAELRGETGPNQYDTSHFNRYRNNWMGISPQGETRPNGVDFYWDLEGEGNCWEGNRAAPGRSIRSDPPTLPNCSSPSVHSPISRTPVFASCAAWSSDEPNPPGCDWVERPPRPA